MSFISFEENDLFRFPVSAKPRIVSISDLRRWSSLSLKSCVWFMEMMMSLELLLQGKSCLLRRWWSFPSKVCILKSSRGWTGIWSADILFRVINEVTKEKKGRSKGSETGIVLRNHKRSWEEREVVRTQFLCVSHRLRDANVSKRTIFVCPLSCKHFMEDRN